MHAPFQFLRLLTALLLAGIISGCSPKSNDARFLDAAKKFFDAGDYEKAKIEYVSVLRQNPGDTTALTQLAVIWLEQGAPRRAVPFLMELRKLLPKDVSLRTKLMATLMALQQTAGAHEEAAAILALAPDSGEALLTLAGTARTPEEIASARETIEKFPARASAAFHAASAPLLLKAGDAAAAEKAVRQAIAAEPKCIPAHSALARMCAAKNDMKEAEAEFKTVSELAPLRSAERLNYAEFKLRQGKLDEAGTLARDVTRQAADFLPALLLSARASLAAKKPEEAQTILQKVTGIDGENFEGRMLEAQVLVETGKTKPAIDALEKILEAFPAHPEVRYRLAQAYMKTGDTGKAEPLLSKTVATNPDFVEGVLVLAGLKLNKGQAAEVIQEMRTILAKRPDLAPAKQMLALACQAAGRLDEAVTIMENLIKESPSGDQYHFQFGLMLRQAGKLKEARRWFEEILKRAPTDLPANNQLVDLNIIEKNFDSALTGVQAIVEKNPSAEAWYLKGKVLVAQEKWDDAEEALLKSAGVREDFLPAFQLLIQVYVRAKKLPQALNRVNQILAKQPENGPALLVAALISEEQKEFGRAGDYYEKLLALKPGLPQVINNLACLYMDRLNNLEKAHTLAREARKLRPAAGVSLSQSVKLESAAIADTLGWVLYKRGEYAEALDLAREAAQALGDNAEVQYHLGMAAAMMGPSAEARAALSTALKPASGVQGNSGLPDDHPGRAEIQGRLALLGEENAVGTLPLKELEVLAGKQPDDPLLQFRLGGAYAKENDIQRAAASYEKALHLNPAMVASSIDLAELFAGPLRNQKKALELAKGARRRAPKNAIIAGRLGSIAFDAGDRVWAHELLSEASRSPKPDAAVLRSLAWAAYSLGRVTEARESMERFLQSSPESPEAAGAKTFLSLTAPVAGGSALAERSAAAESVLRTEPNNVPALVIRARAQARRGENAPAIATCNAVLERFPEFAPAQVELAALYADDPGTRDKAWHLATAAREALPEDPELIRVLAELSYYKNDYPYAIQLLQPSAAKGTLNSEGLFYLGMSQWQLNDKTNGQSTLKRAIEMGLPKPLTEEASRIVSGSNRP